jgi:2'-5' RNA ligase
MSTTIRAFIAIELPPQVRTVLARVQSALKAHDLKLKWVRPENIHLTLKFLGDVPTAQVDTIYEHCRDACGTVSPLDLTAQGLGVFPGLRRPRVLWAGVGGATNALAALQAGIEQGLATCDHRPDRKAFRAHLTLARIKTRVSPGRLAEALEAQSGFGPQPFKATVLTLMQSRLTPSGAIYSPLKMISLAG